MLASLKIPSLSLFFLPLGLLLFFTPSFLFSSFSRDPFWQPWDSLAHPCQGSFSPPPHHPHQMGQKLEGVPCCSGTGWQQLQSPLLHPPPLTPFSQMPINRCQKCWPGLKDPRLHNNPTILAVHPVSINIVVFEPLGPVEFTSMLSRSLHWASA